MIKLTDGTYLKCPDCRKHFVVLIDEITETLENEPANLTKIYCESCKANNWFQGLDYDHSGADRAS